MVYPIAFPLLLVDHEQLGRVVNVVLEAAATQERRL